MATFAARVTGTVLRTDEMSGTKNGRDWKMRIVRVLVGGEDIAEVNLPDESSAPIRGEQVDWLVSVGARSGGANFPPSPSIKLLGDWKNVADAETY